MFEPRVVTGLCIALIIGVAGAAAAQEDMISPPAPLQWPAEETDSVGTEAIEISAFRTLMETGANEFLCRMMMERDDVAVPEGYNWTMCPQSYKDAIAAREGSVSWAEGAMPTECAECVGRPFTSQTTSLDRPNTVYAKLLGRLEFDVSSVRTVSYFYEAQFHCAVPLGARAGDVVVRVEFGEPVVGEPGTLETFLDLSFLPLTISQRLTGWIEGELAAAPTRTDTLRACASIGAARLENRLDDRIRYRPPSRGRAADRVRVADAVGSTARVRFLGITRRPPNARYAPDEDAGRFQAYLNGELVVFPDLPELHLPAAGGTAPLNLCRTLDVQGADRLQIIFANSGGGGVWSQFGEGDDFGAGTPRRMTTGRTVMVPGLPGPPPQPGRPPTRPKPEALVLREYELLYQVDYVARPSEVVAEQPAAGGRGNEARPPRGVEPTRSDGGGTTPEPCREI